VNIKRLAAIAMYGSWGTLRPKQLVQAEFTAALAVTVALGIWLAIEASGLGTLILIASPLQSVCSPLTVGRAASGRALLQAPPSRGRSRSGLTPRCAWRET
jgi:hypothetical protein